MDIGTFIFLKRYDVELQEMEKYHSKVIDQREDFFYIDQPTNVNTKRTANFLPNEQVLVDYTKDGVVYEFKATVLGRVHKNIPALKVTLPKEEDMKRIQRREYVRIEIDVDVAIHCPLNSFHPVVSVTADISGGGAKIYNPPETLKEGQKIMLYLVLSKDSAYEYIETEAEVIRFQEIKQVKTVSVKFLFKHENDRQKIIQYCFYIQRKNRQLGIL